MKTLITIAFLLINTLHIFSSSGDKYYYFYTEAQLKDNRKSQQHNSCQVLSLMDDIFYIGTVTEFDEGNITPTGIQVVSFGKIRLDKNMLYCFDGEHNRTYKFKQIDFYTLEAINHTAVFKKGTKLYLHLYESGLGQFYHAFYQPVDLIKSDYWKTGIKNGIHSYYNTNKTDLFYYNNNVVTDSITVFDDSISMKKEKMFVEKYGDRYESNTVEMLATDNTQMIATDELVVFWNKFSEAFLQNDTLILSDLINEDIILFGQYFSNSVSEINTMNFKYEIVSKSQFLKEFKQSLNPVYLELLKDYNIEEDMQGEKLYSCNKTIGKNYYFVETYLSSENNDGKALLSMALTINSNDSCPETKKILFIFRKTDSKIKLKGIQFFG